MSLTLSMDIALSGLQATQKALEVTSRNVSNANTEGYSRKIVNLENVLLDGTGAGVAIASITRVVDEFLLRDLRNEISNLERFETLDTYFSRIQDLFGSLSSDSSISDRLADLTATFEALSIDPESGARRLDVIEAALAVARQINDMSDDVQLLREQTELDIDAAVEAVNTQLRAIADLNTLIAENLALDRPVGDLQDQRDIALDKLAKEMDITYFTRDTGEIVVYTPHGEVLVDSLAATLTYDPVSPVTFASTFNDITVNGDAITADITTGRIGALIDMRDTTLANLQTQLDELAEHLRDEINLAHNRGTGLPAPNALTGTRTFADITVDQVTLSEDVRIATVDANGVIQAFYDVPAGAYTIEALRDDINANLGAAVTVTAINGSAFQISADNAAHGVAIVDLPATGDDITVTYDDGTGPVNYQGFSNFFGLNDFFVTPNSVAGDSVAGIAGVLQVDQRVVDTPSLLPRGRLYNDTVTLPVPGTTVGVTIGDNTVAKMIADSFTKSVTFDAVGGLPSTNSTVIEYASQILGFNATASANNSQRIRIQEALVDELKHKAASISGVNVDEEMANLIIFQNAYAASARVIQVTDEMLETLLNLI